jgi:hypothetical protein
LIIWYSLCIEYSFPIYGTELYYTRMTKVLSGINPRLTQKSLSHGITMNFGNLWRCPKNEHKVEAYRSLANVGHEAWSSHPGCLQTWAKALGFQSVVSQKMFKHLPKISQIFPDMGYGYGGYGSSKCGFQPPRDFDLSILPLLLRGSLSKRTITCGLGCEIPQQNKEAVRKSSINGWIMDDDLFDYWKLSNKQFGI